MVRIFVNIDQDLLGTLRATMHVSKRADFCVGLGAHITTPLVAIESH